jgi:hypothetical protein
LRVDSWRHESVVGHSPASNDVSTGRAIAEAVSRWLPTAVARVQSRVWSSGICGGKVASGQVFSEYFGFPCHSFHQILHPHNHPGAGTIGQWVADVPSGPSLDSPPTMQIKKKGRKQRTLLEFVTRKLLKSNSVAFSPQANYIDRATASSRRS